MNKTFRYSVVSAAVSLLMANQAGAANTWSEARNDAMGGTGVASANYGSAVMINPALLAKSQPDDDVSVVIPSVGAQITDKDNLRDQIDDISNDIDRYENVIDNLTPTGILLDPQGTMNQFQSAAGDLAGQLEDLRGKTARANAGAGIAVSVPTSAVSLAFVTKAYAHARVSSNIDQSDIDYLRNIQNSDAFAAGQAAGALINGSDQLTNNLNSTASGKAAIVSDYGIAIARKFDIGGVPVSLGVTPKLQQTWLYNYTTSIDNYHSDDWKKDKYRNDDTGFNVDVGIAADFGENWTVGLSGQNLMSRDIDTKDVRITNGTTGVTTNYKDTYQIRPLVTAGVAWHTDLLTLTADGDLTETKGFKSEDNSQYVGVGAEVTPLSWLAVRAGYRADVKGNDSNVFTAGVGFAPMNTVHVDLMGLYGEDQTWGAGVQLGLTF
ncbi:conjugal transfer protein TraF [Enterobacter sp. CC120223-11]|uniref:conjugal transfer protein TraF n=1 Tax=Enterobacter sp. CC120223-11 TaxID=1378073 RepID=UPI000BD6336A|nr:conjugal transfer protein TraF [Enterobacter sp. CC120223-11]SNY73121.1 plasmid transfer operon, TraF, protein [Enterobacter sp. CC120223-11]